MDRALLPNYFLEMFTSIYPTHDHDTRQRDLPMVARGKTSLADNSLRYLLPREIIKTPDLILDKLATHSFLGFSNYIKQYHISFYSPICEIEYCYICNR